MIRILIADDHLVVREGLQLILSMEEDMAVVGEAADGETAVRLAGELQPDVVLMDLRMPGMGGMEAIDRILAEWPDMAIVILTTYNEDDLMLRGLQAGARGFLLKDTGRQTLFHTIRAAARGETLMQPEILLRVLAHTRAGNQTSAPALPPRQDGGLTEREMEVLTAVARGDRNKEIALALGVTERTVKAHLTNVYDKLGVDSRAGAVSTAIQRGILAR
ncbi:MAG: response regulator transcription factor [Chloroflexi bacterium]|nr:response regulator transcription factor [Chloroflexota bacterium]MBK6708826.1 response regulator transcription factor [Chloroflexota bacterium]MBK8934403.1 response regulator transcription factor [Chloroflexota bacterium]MBP7591271.1 response regulator transcription factor [Chloroflexota bacterium]